eukprot:GFYU01002074.1.p1 GENE.GFYU01002074.1~~GFYU01002074.1.p1  ORF type:complete len:937 (+),score=239.21 GFYU01002074.1:170-2980(+)
MVFLKAVPPEAAVPYSYVMMFTNEEVIPDVTKKRKLLESRRRILNALKCTGLKLWKQLSKDSDKKIVMIGASEDMLEIMAEDLELRMQLKMDNAYAPFKRAKKDLFLGTGEDVFAFRSKEKQVVVLACIEQPPWKGGAGINVAKEIQLGNIRNFFPVHGPLRPVLINEWAYAWKEGTKQPLDLIFQYYGGKIALYFGFLAFYTRWLKFPAGAGAVLWLLQTVGATGNETVAAYACFMSLWASFFLEYWKRENAELIWKWDLMDFEMEEQPRAEFRGELRISPVTGEEEVFYDKWRRHMKLPVTLMVLISGVGVVLSGIFAVLVFRTWLQSAHGLGWLGGSANGVMIATLNAVYKKVAYKLSEWENYRTDTQFSDSVITKAFAFQFCNSYLVLYIVAFLKPNIHNLNLENYLAPCPCTSGAETCADSERSCVGEIRTLLASIFLVQLVIGNVQEYLIPLAKKVMIIQMEKLRMKLDRVQLDDDDDNILNKSKPEREAQLPPYDFFDDYNELIIQYGYIAFFAATFPLVACAAFLNNLVEIRTDAYKLLTAYQRPEAFNAADIGMWFTVLEIMTFTAITTNCALIFFTKEYSNFGVSNSGEDLVWGFFISEHVLVLFKVAIGTIVPDVPDDVAESIQRARYEAKRLMMGDDGVDLRALRKKGAQDDDLFRKTVDFDTVDEGAAEIEAFDAANLKVSDAVALREKKERGDLDDDDDDPDSHRINFHGEAEDLPEEDDQLALEEDIDPKEREKKRVRTIMTLFSRKGRANDFGRRASAIENGYLDELRRKSQTPQGSLLADPDRSDSDGEGLVEPATLVKAMSKFKTGLSPRSAAIHPLPPLPHEKVEPRTETPTSPIAPSPKPAPAPWKSPTDPNPTPPKSRKESQSRFREVRKNFQSFEATDEGENADDVVLYATAIAPRQSSQPKEDANAKPGPKPI